MYANDRYLPAYEYAQRFEKRRLWLLRRMQVSVTCDNNHHQMTHKSVFSSQEHSIKLPFGIRLSNDARLHKHNSLLCDLSRSSQRATIVHKNERSGYMWSSFRPLVLFS